MKNLRFIAALFVAFNSLLFATPVNAQTLEEAQVALAAGRQEVIDATQAATDAEALVLQRQADVAAAEEAVATAQANYDTNLIPDPDWVHPTYEVPHTEIITHTEQVSHIELVPHTTSVVTGGLTADVFNRRGYNASPPIPSATEVPYYSTTVPNINFQWGGGNILGSNLSEDAIVRFTGNITSPVSDSYTFYTPADDGTRLYIDGNLLINDWYDKGGGGSTSAPVNLEAGTVHSLTLYYYENGGGANVWLNYATPTSGYQLVPGSWLGNRVEEVTTYEEVVVWETVTTYEEVITYTTELVPGAEAPLIHDPALLEVLTQAQVALTTAQEAYTSAVAEQSTATERLSAALAAIPILEQAVADLTPAPTPEPTPTPTPTPTPSPVPTPTPTPTIDPTPTPTPTETQEPIVDPTPTPVDPDPTPSGEPTPSPEATTEPTVEPTPNVPEPTPAPEPSSPAEAIAELTQIDPQELTVAQVEQLVTAAEATLATEPEGSPKYEEALAALLIAAQADDIQVSEELAAVPLVGPAAQAAVAVINALGNLGADMSPAHRATAKKEVVAAIVVTQVTTAAVSAATSAASSTSSSSGSAARRREGK